jgi:hypothetical protein
MNVDEWMKAESKMMGTNDGIGGPDRYYVGCADYPDQEALMLLVEAAGELCGMRKDKAARLTRRALSLITHPSLVVSEK